jgi:hypothetical protein
MKNDIFASFTKLMGYAFLRHRGFIIERKNGGFAYRGEYFADLKELDAYIDLRFQELENSLNKIKSNE